MPADEKESMPDQYDKVSLENFIKYSKDMFAYWTENDFARIFPQDAYIGTVQK